MNDKRINDLVEQFKRDGCLVIPEVLTKRECADLRAEIDARAKGKMKTRRVYIFKRMFEKGLCHLELFQKEPVVTLAERIIGDPKAAVNKEAFTQTSLQCHVIHNNALVTPPGRDGINNWHQDDPPHFLWTGDGKIPDQVRDQIHLPVLAFTVNYYLTDVRERKFGPTKAVKGSHKFGRLCPVKPHQEGYKEVDLCGPAGSAVFFNNQVWHSGSPNLSNQPRYVSQVTYARRLVGHKYSPFVGYTLPEEITEYVQDNARLKRLVGFLGNGAYG